LRWRIRAWPKFSRGGGALAINPAFQLAKDNLGALGVDPATLKDPLAGQDVKARS